VNELFQVLACWVAIVYLVIGVLILWSTVSMLLDEPRREDTVFWVFWGFVAVASLLWLCFGWATLAPAIAVGRSEDFFAATLRITKTGTWILIPIIVVCVVGACGITWWDIRHCCPPDPKPPDKDPL
jgi:hypothetical protein